MDRLSTVVVAVALGAVGCDGGSSTGGGTPSTRSRSESVQATAPAAVDPKEFCETWHEEASAPALAWPPLTGPAPASTGPTTQGKSRWLNVWATWCKPCIEELPRLRKWQAELGKKADFELVFLSADGDPAVVKEFAKAHPEVVGSLELQAADALQPWATSIGVAGQAVLPIHVFVDGKDRVRCVRTAGIGEGDRAVVEQLLMGL